MLARSLAGGTNCKRNTSILVIETETFRLRKNGRRVLRHWQRILIVVLPGRSSKPFNCRSRHIFSLSGSITTKTREACSFGRCGRPRQAIEVSAPAGDPLQLLFEELDALSRKTDRYKQGSRPSAKEVQAARGVNRVRWAAKRMRTC